MSPGRARSEKKRRSDAPRNEPPDILGENVPVWASAVDDWLRGPRASHLVEQERQLAALIPQIRESRAGANRKRRSGHSSRHSTAPKPKRAAATETISLVSSSDSSDSEGGRLVLDNPRRVAAPRRAVAELPPLRDAPGPVLAAAERVRANPEQTRAVQLLSRLDILEQVRLAAGDASACRLRLKSLYYLARSLSTAPAPAGDPKPAGGRTVERAIVTSRPEFRTSTSGFRTVLAAPAGGQSRASRAPVFPYAVTMESLFGSVTQ